MSYPNHISSRRIAARFALVGAICAGSFIVAPAAMASPASRAKAISGVRAHVHRADVALQMVSSAAASGSISVPLSQLTSQLGVAAHLSAELSVQAHTPNVAKLAAGALKLVANEEAKAEATLNALSAAVSGAEQMALVKADAQVTQGQELTLSVLAKLSIETKVQAKAIADQVAALAGQVHDLLSTVVGQVTSVSSGCLSANVVAQLVSTETASVQSDVARTISSLPLIGSVLDAGGSLLATLSADETAQIEAQVQADVNCQPSSDGDGSGTSGGSGSTAGSSTTSPTSWPSSLLGTLGL
jgi:hypothetical protein